MSGLTVTIWPLDQIQTLDAFGTAQSLNVEAIEQRDGKWIARINAFRPAYFNSEAGRTISREPISTKSVKTQALAQEALAGILTAMNSIELADGTKVDISALRVTPGSI